MDEITLKTLLLDIQNGKTTWQEQNQTELIDSMMEHIGSPDSELRDKLIYRGFSQLIQDENLIPEEKLVDLLTKALGDEYLFYEIGDVGTDHIFKRSFSVLLITLILGKDLEHSFIPLQLLDRTRNELLLYLDLEQDLRGFVSEKGWAHSVAHTADAIDELVKNPKMDVKFFPSIFQGLANKALTFADVYIADEAERLLKPIMVMLEIGIATEIVDDLFDKIPSFLKLQKSKLEEEKYVKLNANCKSFLKSFYVCVGSSEKYIEFQKKISSCLKEL